MASSVRLSLLALGAGLLMIGRSSAQTRSSSVSVQTINNADSLESTFAVLGWRQCLPMDFNSSPSWYSAKECNSKVTNGGVPAECAGVPALVQLYNCLAHSRYQVDTVDGNLCFNVTLKESLLLSYSKDASWHDAQENRDVACRLMSSAALKPRQQAVYSYLCARFSLFADCESQRSQTPDDLDDVSLTQRISFLQGNCPMSPNSMLDAFGEITGHTNMECGQRPNSETLKEQYYDAIKHVSCLLQDFIGDDDHLNFYGLVDALAKKFGGYWSVPLQWLDDSCSPLALNIPEITVNQFIDCWASRGLAYCAFSDANLLALDMPESCAIVAY
ncbi:uncharacterized protein LOC122387999 [Amphibalanus amphitrite]|uniref:uncharacterized protein LOC122387999 n=1 Tax=Amphibalanus amphitrite TaxID=1232801 RepID=UPI001C9131A0|nr:uncharacterized protein LOC122387999 [Amphibalanus amphitrite]